MQQLRDGGWSENPDGSWSKRTGDSWFRIPHSDVKVPPTKPPKRLRQSSKPLLNKLEQAFKTEYLDLWGYRKALPQAIKFRLGNGIAYKPDFVDLTVLPVKAWEVKGPHAFRGGFENLKVAAGLYPDVQWFLAWKEDNLWRQQEVLA